MGIKADCLVEYIVSRQRWRHLVTSSPPESISRNAKHLEKALLNISAREQRRIGQDLHDGLGQHLTGIAFMAKVHEAKLASSKLPEAADAAKIVRLGKRSDTQDS